MKYAQFQDLTGKKFGRLTVVSRAPSRKAKSGTKTMWFCRCDCNNTIRDNPYYASVLVRGSTTSCGCMHNELASKRFSKDLTGQRFGKLTVISRGPNAGKKKGHATWFCRCECNNQVRKEPYWSYSLLAGATKSCGCLKILPPGVAALNGVLSVYKRHAEERGLSFELTLDQFRILTSQNCHYCGAVPSNKKRAGGGDLLYNGIDRTDNKIGYKVDNCVSACFKCNKFKKERDYNTFLEHITTIYEHLSLGLNCHNEKGAA